MGKLHVGKLHRDRESVSKLARFVLTLGPGGVISDCHENEDFSSEIFAVIAPMDPTDQVSQNAVIFELGISRTKPYQASSKSTKTGEILGADRRKTREPTTMEKESIWKYLSREVIPALVNERRQSWKSQASWWYTIPQTGKTIIFNRGRRFTVSMDDHWFTDRIFELEWRYLKKQYLGEYAHWISRWLQDYTCAWRPCYTENRSSRRKIPKRSTKLWKTVELIRGIHFLHPYLSWRFLESLGNRSPLVRNALNVSGSTPEEKPYRKQPQSSGIPNQHLRVVWVRPEFICFEVFPQKITTDHIRTIGPDFNEEESDIPFRVEEYQTVTEDHSTDPPF
jgi:hypothetical protein